MWAAMLGTTDTNNKQKHSDTRGIQDQTHQTHEPYSAFSLQYAYWYHRRNARADITFHPREGLHLFLMAVHSTIAQYYSQKIAILLKMKTLRVIFLSIQTKCASKVKLMFRSGPLS